MSVRRAGIPLHLPGAAGAALSHDLVGGSAGLGVTVTPELLPGQHITYTHAGSSGEVLGLAGDDLIFLDLQGDDMLDPYCSGPRVVLPAVGGYTAVLTYEPFSAVSTTATRRLAGGRGVEQPGVSAAHGGGRVRWQGSAADLLGEVT